MVIELLPWWLIAKSKSRCCPQTEDRKNRGILCLSTQAVSARENIMAPDDGRRIGAC